MYALGIQVYKPANKAEVRVVYRIRGTRDPALNNTRHQKSYSFNKYGEQGAWELAHKALQHMTDTQTLPADFPAVVGHGTSFPQKKFIRPPTRCEGGYYGESPPLDYSHLTPRAPVQLSEGNLPSSVYSSFSPLRAVSHETGALRHQATSGRDYCLGDSYCAIPYNADHIMGPPNRRPDLGYPMWAAPSGHPGDYGDKCPFNEEKSGPGGHTGENENLCPTEPYRQRLPHEPYTNQPSQGELKPENRPTMIQGEQSFLPFGVSRPHGGVADSIMKPVTRSKRGRRSNPPVKSDTTAIPSDEIEMAENPYSKTYSTSMRRTTSRTGGKSGEFQDDYTNAASSTGHTSATTALAAAYTSWSRAKTNSKNGPSHRFRRVTRGLAKESGLNIEERSHSLAPFRSKSPARPGLVEALMPHLSQNFSHRNMVSSTLHPRANAPCSEISQDDEDSLDVFISPTDLDVDDQVHSRSFRVEKKGCSLVALRYGPENGLPCRQWWALLPPYQNQEFGPTVKSPSSETASGKKSLGRRSSMQTDDLSEARFMAGTQWVELPILRGVRLSPVDAAQISDCDTEGSEEKFEDGNVFAVDLGFNSYESSGVGVVCPYPDSQPKKNDDSSFIETNGHIKPVAPNKLCHIESSVSM